MAASASRVPASSSRRCALTRPAGKSWAASSSAHCVWRSSTASCESGDPGGSVRLAAGAGKRHCSALHRAQARQ